MYLNTIILLQYCWCHSGCSCLNGYDIVMFLGCWVIFFIIFFLFHSLLKSRFLDARGGFFVFFFTSMWSACPFLKAGPLPWASQAIHWAAHFYSAMVCYTPQSAQSTGSVCVCVCARTCVCVCVSVGACVCVSERVCRVDQTTVTSRPEPYYEILHNL